MGESLQHRIEQHYASLPESERKIADLVRDFPGEIAAYSATELAALAGASKAAMTRLVRRLGYDSFEEARRAARDARTAGSPLYLLSKEPPEAPFAERLQAHLAGDLETLNATFEELDEAAFEAVVAATAAARRVVVLGYRNSHYLAGYLRWQLIQVRGAVQLLPAAGETLAEHLADLGPEDLLIAVGLRRRPAALAEAVARAAEAGVPVALVADRGAPPLAGARWSLRCATRGEALFDRYAAAMSLLHLLAVAVVERLGKPGRRRLERIEALHEDFHDFG